MTREEQMINAAHKKYPYEGGTKGMICEFSIPIFIQGARWADEHPNLSEEEQVGMGELGMSWQKKALIEKANILQKCCLMKWVLSMQTL